MNHHCGDALRDSAGADQQARPPLHTPARGHTHTQARKHARTRAHLLYDCLELDGVPQAIRSDDDARPRGRDADLADLRVACENAPSSQAGQGGSCEGVRLMKQTAVQSRARTVRAKPAKIG